MDDSTNVSAGGMTFLLDYEAFLTAQTEIILRQ